ncbi:hypothetical protein [Streptomyces sp. GMR22]|uniref:hypothetical protein n=1 Tax=Streptomyces sp. GMR22 TaxID=2759524 RepID=UPI0015FBC33B|nr:hypothetical protein [Streptomyces sp. GMR22]MBA6440041.1 hypothetical protein [Streptomyces sp. GMR22]
MDETTLALIAIIISVGTAVGTFIYAHQQMKAAKRIGVPGHQKTSRRPVALMLTDAMSKAP